MPHPLLWHYPHQAIQDYSPLTNASSRPRYALKRAHTIAGPISVPRAEWASSAVGRHTQTFTLPDQQNDSSLAVSRTYAWSDPHRGTQSPSLVSETSSDFSSPSSDLSKLPFFRSQLFKQQNSEGDSGKRRHQDNVKLAKDRPPEREASRLSVPCASLGNKSLSEPPNRPVARKRPLHLPGHVLFPKAERFVKIYVHDRSTQSTRYELCSYPIPEYLVCRIPRLVKPKDPKRVQATLKLLKPMVIFAEFDCDEGCRSRGICVHFSLVLGCRQSPDGLICPVCQHAELEKGYTANRMCGRHNRSTLSQFVVNLPEDILASEKQATAAEEILRRSWQCNWGGIPSKLQHCRDTYITETKHGESTQNSESNVASPSVEQDCSPKDPPNKRQKRGCSLEYNDREGEFAPAAQHSKNYLQTDIHHLAPRAAATLNNNF